MINVKALNFKPLMEIPLREYMEQFEKMLNVFGYIPIPGVCQTAATVRLALATTQLAVGLISSGLHRFEACWATGVERMALLGRAREDLKWCEHAALNTIRAAAEYLNFGWPIMVVLALWDNLDLRITHRDAESPFSQVARRIDYLQVKLALAESEIIVY